MSILMGVLAEEMDRLNRQEVAFENSRAELPKGYISRKNIKGREYFYLQHKENGKVVSKYIPADKLPEIEEQVKRRKQLDAALQRVRADKKRLRKVLG